MMKTLSLLLMVAMWPMALPAALNVYLELTANGELIPGESTETSLGRENKIEALSFTHEVFQPRDGATGQLTGRRQHGPITITKRIDKSSPLLAKALGNNEAIEGSFRFYRPTPAGDGSTEHFYTVHILGAVSSLRTISPDTLSAETGLRPPMEEVSFVFQQITWTYESTGASYTDEILAGE